MTTGLIFSTIRGCGMRRNTSGVEISAKRSVNNIHIVGRRLRPGLVDWRSASPASIRFFLTLIVCWGYFTHPIGHLFAADFPRAPVAGFSPKIVITTSDRRRTEEFEWEHTLHNGYAGSPLNSPANTNFVVGVLDTGAQVNLVSGDDASILGVEGSRLTRNTIELTGASGTINAPISHPIGVFAQGLSAINSDGNLNLSQLKGHGNVSSVVIPEVQNAGDNRIPSVMGIPYAAFYTTVIRNDQPVTVNIGGEEITSPDVQILNVGDPSVPVFEDQRSIPLRSGGFGGLPPLTAGYSGLDLSDPFNADFRTPVTPTLLTAIPTSIPTGGGLFATLNVGNGEIGPLNPLQQLDVLFDTGAEASIISRAVAANLNLDLLNPDFEIEVLGIGGLTEAVPGFYVDFVQMNASGGALQFSDVPFVVIDVPSPAGGALDGVLGMNFFWNRNLVLEPNLQGSTFLHVSGPLYGQDVLFGDVDLDSDVDADDIDDLFSKRGGDFETADPAVYDLNQDFLVDDADVVVLVENVLGSTFGDANLDGRVDLEDFSLLKQSFGSSAGWNGGDFNGDQIVNLADFTTLKDQFGTVGAPSPAGAAVPEPSTILLALLALFGWSLHGLRRQR